MIRKKADDDDGEDNNVQMGVLFRIRSNFIQIHRINGINVTKKNLLYKIA